MTLVDPDDDFHPPTVDDPAWTETCWFAVAVPERRLSAWFYPFFQPNLGVLACGVYIWDEWGEAPWNCRYAKNLWHLPMTDAPLTDIALPGGLTYRCTEPRRRYEIAYSDPDGEGVSAALTFTGLMPPVAMHTHIDQPGRVEGEIVLNGERIVVDAVGMRDRSWGPRPQVGQYLMSSGSFTASRMGYSWAAAGENDGFLTISAYDGSAAHFSVHGYLLRDGKAAKLERARRRIVERDARTGCQTRVTIEGVDELGRTFQAEGRTRNRLGTFLNPNLYSWGCLTEWNVDGVPVWGEDHENYSAAEIRRFSRDHLRGGASVT